MTARPFLLALSICPLATAGLADVTFIDRAASLTVTQSYDGDWEHYVGGGVAIFDCNGDALPDLYAAGGSSPSRLFVNTTPAPGADIAFTPADAPDLPEVTGAYPLDVDGDGNIDLAVLQVGANTLLRGDGQCHFTPAPAEWNFQGGTGWTTAFTATFEPGQDWPTLVFGNYVDRANPNGPFEVCDDNQLLRPKGRAFASSDVIHPGFCALSMLISDWKRDGTPDLRVSNDRQYYVRNGREQMWRLSPLKEYTADDGWPTLRIWGMGIASRDITGDGLPEVVLTSMGDQLLQFNKGGGLMANAPYSQGTYATSPYVGDDGRPSTGWHSEFGDIDNDGRADLFIAKGNVNQMPSNAIHDPNNLLMQASDGTFVEKGGVAGIATTQRSRGAGLADLNGDGRLDIVVVNRRAPMEIWQNATPDTGHWLGLEPVMQGANTRAIGGFVEVRTPNGTVQTTEITIGGGHASGQAGPLHFGLGDATSADVRITWPDHTTTDWQTVQADQRLRLGPAGNQFTLLP